MDFKKKKKRVQLECNFKIKKLISNPFYDKITTKEAMFTRKHH